MMSHLSTWWCIRITTMWLIRKRGHLFGRYEPAILCIHSSVLMYLTTTWGCRNAVWRFFLEDLGFLAQYIDTQFWNLQKYPPGRAVPTVDLDAAEVVNAYCSILVGYWFYQKMKESLDRVVFRLNGLSTVIPIVHMMLLHVGLPLCKHQLVVPV